MPSRGRISKLAAHAEPVAAPSNTSFKDVPNPEVLSNLLHIDGSAFVHEGRIASDYE